MIDLELRDTPALAILKRRPDLAARIAPADLAAAQDVLRVAKLLLGSFAEAFALHGLSPGRYALLMALHGRGDGMAPSDLADRLGVTRATITGLIAGLVREGLVHYLAAEETDRRRKAVGLTLRGTALLDQVVPEIFGQMADLLAPLSATERTTLLTLLHKVEGHIACPSLSGAED
ncbi:MarR family winged helix-turn-helix transcriptional regulator [Zavarzinia sp. CC-PAN008]|uniref:MarR family winged helix-turn-helix transcriptional regulator n=1 Tax=Zavarzinia sp. CC-PAN008 TaxID=3243332 RepID=UPI003F743311